MFGGWQIEGNLPKDIKKFIIAGAPHTSNWDLFFLQVLPTNKAFFPILWESTLYSEALCVILCSIWGVYPSTEQSGQPCEQVAEEFARREELAIIATEGSRSTNGEWKSGFYHIAQVRSRCPSLCGQRQKDIRFRSPIGAIGRLWAGFIATCQMVPI